AWPVVYFVRRGHLPISRFLFYASLLLSGCRSQTPAVTSSQQQGPQQVSRLQVLSRMPGIAIRLPAKGGLPQLYRLPRLTLVEGILRGRLPPVDRVLGLDPESELLFVTTAKHELLSYDLGSGRGGELFSDHVLRSAWGARSIVPASRRSPTGAGVLPLGSSHLCRSTQRAGPGCRRSLRSSGARRRGVTRSGRGIAARSARTLA